MNSVGIDVSKGKSMVAALRPVGEVAMRPTEYLLFRFFTYVVHFCTAFSHQLNNGIISPKAPNTAAPINRPGSAVISAERSA